jgi:hypothetical protein
MFWWCEVPVWYHGLLFQDKLHVTIVFKLLVLKTFICLLWRHLLCASARAHTHTHTHTHTHSLSLSLSLSNLTSITNSSRYTLKDFLNKWKNIYINVGRNKINLPYLGRTFVRVIYINVTKSTYVGSWTFMEICYILAVTHCTCSARCVSRTQRRSVLVPTAKPRYTQGSSCLES